MNIDCHQWAITTLGLAELALGEIPPILWCQTLFFFKGMWTRRTHFLAWSQDIDIYVPKPKVEEMLLFCFLLQTTWPLLCVSPQGAWRNHCYRHHLWLPWRDGRRLPADSGLGETLQIPKSFHKPVLPQTRDPGCQDGPSPGACGECGPAVAQCAYIYIYMHTLLWFISTSNCIRTSFLGKPPGMFWEHHQRIKSVIMCSTHMN